MSQPTILHVEDDPNDVLLLEHACRKAGINCNIQRVADGDEAIAYLRRERSFRQSGAISAAKITCWI